MFSESNKTDAKITPNTRVGDSITLSESKTSIQLGNPTQPSQNKCGAANLGRVGIVDVDFSQGHQGQLLYQDTNYLRHLKPNLETAAFKLKSVKIRVNSLIFPLNQQLLMVAHSLVGSFNSVWSLNLNKKTWRALTVSHGETPSPRYGASIVGVLPQFPFCSFSLWYKLLIE